MIIRAFGALTFLLSWLVVLWVVPSRILQGVADSLRSILPLTWKESRQAGPLRQCFVLLRKQGTSPRTAVGFAWTHVATGEVCVAMAQDLSGVRMPVATGLYLTKPASSRRWCLTPNRLRRGEWWKLLRPGTPSLDLTSRLCLNLIPGATRLGCRWTLETPPIPPPQTRTSRNRIGLRSSPVTRST